MNPVITVALIVSAAIIVFGISDMLRFGSDRWALANRSRPAWMALSIVFGPLAVLLYWGTVRYQLRFPERYVVDP